MNEEIKDLFSSSIVIHYVTNIDKNLHQVFQPRLEFMLGLGRGIEGDVSQSPTKLELQKRNTFSAPMFLQTAQGSTSQASPETTGVTSRTVASPRSFHLFFSFFFSACLLTTGP